MYQIRCDDYILYDPRDEELIVHNPKCKLGVNMVGEGSFTILANHPYYGKLKRLKSIFEIRQDDQPIFRGRMTNASRDLHNRFQVDLEGVLGFTNDTHSPPYNYPEDYPDALNAENIVEHFLGTVLAWHNLRVKSWQKIKLGRVTVRDPNNYITRSSKAYTTTWDTLKTKLFDSSLGGYMRIRYEADGNYLDYLESFDEANTQRVEFGENLLDILTEVDGSETYSVILPVGKDGMTMGIIYDGNGNPQEELGLTEDLVRWADHIYSKSAVEEIGWVCIPPEESKWDDIETVEGLQEKGMEYLTGVAMRFSEIITIKAADLRFADDEIQSFRVGQNILVNSPVHGVVNISYPLTQLDIDILHPQNTTITIGSDTRTLIGMNTQQQSTSIERVEQVAQLVETVEKDTLETLQQQLIIQQTSMVATCTDLILAALEQYVETGEYTEFKETVQAQLEILASEITMSFTKTTESIAEVDGDIQAKFNELYKYIRFSNDGIEIGADENSLKLTLDNDMIQFTKNGLPFGWWDGTDFHTGNIVVKVNERAQFGNFAFVPRSNGSLSFLKVGG